MHTLFTSRMLPLARRTLIPMAILSSTATAFLPNTLLHRCGGNQCPTFSTSTSVFADASMVEASQENLLKLYNEQVTNEFFASQLYVSASIWFQARNWEGMASYMLEESGEERGHALSFIDFANKRNFPIELQSLPKPPSQWESPQDVWEDLLKAEQDNTKKLLELAQVANDCNDFATLAFLNPFHMEQVESEDKLGTILAKVNAEMETPGLLRELDTELGKEVAP